MPGADARAGLPAFVAPQLATLVDAPPAGGDWRYEVKYDGYRLLARLDRTVRLFTRNRQDWTRRLQPLARELASLRLRGTWLDGEIVVHDANGRTSFQALQQAFDGASAAKIVYYVFDAPFLDGRDLRAQPLLERKRALAAALGKGTPTVRYGADLAAAPQAALAEACRLGLEGLIAKRTDAPYAGGRTRAWLKLKCRPRQEFVIAGYTAPAGSRTHFGSLLLGFHDDDRRLRYAGRVGTGFGGATLSEIAAQLAPLKRDAPPYHAEEARRLPRKDVQWVEPRLVAEIDFTGWTEDGVLRHPSFLGLRTDKPSAAVRRERSGRVRPGRAARKRPEPTARGRRTAAKRAGDGPVHVAGVTISHPDRPIWPDEGITKADLARYYESVGRRLLPHVDGRPLSLVRCPDGAAKQCFFQRHMGPERPPGVKSFVWTRAAESRHYLYVDALAAVIQLVQRGVVELHTWGSRLPRAGRPDRITIDLDPDPALAWAEVAESARLVRSLAQELGLRAFVKTTGGKGLHVVMPIAARHEWDEVRSFARSMAEALEHEMPERFTATVAKRARTGKVFVDYLRNGEAASAVAAFSARARPGAPVSMPIAWSELAEDVRDGRFSVRTVPALLERRRVDPWAEYARSGRALTNAMRRRLAPRSA